MAGAPPPSPSANKTGDGGRPRLAPASRRRVIGASAVVAVLVGLALTVLIDGGEEPPSAVEAAGPPATDAAFVVPEIGVSVRYPEGWSADRRQGVVRLRHDSGSALVAIAATGRSREATEVLSAAVERTGAEYAQFERLGGQRLALSGLPTRAQTFLGETEDGSRRRILLATVEGNRRAYLVSTFTTEDFDLFEVESILNSLSLTR